MRALVAALLVLHGVVHAIMFGLAFSAQARADLDFDPSHSWLVGDARRFGFAWALTVVAAFAMAAVAYLARATWWPTATIVAAALSIALLLVFATRWWIAGWLISGALIVVALRVDTGQ